MTTSHTAPGYRVEEVLKTGSDPVSDLLDRLTGEELQSLAALGGAPAGIAELAFATMPQAMQEWAQTYELAHFEGPSVKVTDLGWQVIEGAARRCPEPLADLGMDQIKQSISQAISGLPEPRVGIKLARG